jgi:hypothetical protein
MKARRVRIHSEAAQLGNSGGGQTRGRWDQTGPGKGQGKKSVPRFTKATNQCEELPRQHDLFPQKQVVPVGIVQP